MRILFVHASAQWSTADVGQGYARALKALGHEVAEFNTPNRLIYHGLALKNSPRPELADDVPLVTRLASEGIVVEALRERAELIIVTAGGGIHPNGLELCNRAGFPIAVLFTESPYEDDEQAYYSQHCGHVFSNDRYSARVRGWHYLPAAFDPEIHHPYASDPEDACDVLVIGTGWAERTKLLEGVDWSGIRFRLLGQWPSVDSKSPLWPHLESTLVDNSEAARLYSSAKLCINTHRFHPQAESLNPRAYELAACGVFQVSDYRDELRDVFGPLVPVYQNSRELGELLRIYLRQDQMRQDLARAQRQQVLQGGHSFQYRAVQLLTAIRQGGT